MKTRNNNMINTRTAIAGMVFITMVNGFMSVNMFTSQSKFYSNEVDKLLDDNIKLHSELKEFYKFGVEVDVTMYQPTHYQTDDTPDITADGTKIRISKASEYKFVALSRNLLKRWGGPFDYGDFIYIKGTKDKDGVYQVRDTMNSKWVNIVDILESTHVQPYKYENVHIYKMNWTDNLALINKS
jgi:3D (Asp-Asp-Asp) domain-containing protein